MACLYRLCTKGRAPRTKETLPDFREKCRVTRHSRVFRGLTGSQRTPGFWGITMEVDQNKAKAIISAKAPQNKKELQKFLGQVNYLRRFFSNLVGKTKVFSDLIKMKEMEEFKWEEHHQTTFNGIKVTFLSPLF